MVPAPRLLALLALAGAAQGAAIEFLEPRDGQIVVGATRFRFQVDPAEPLDRIDVYVAGELIGSATAPAWDLTWTAAELLAGVQIVAVGYRDGAPAGQATIRTSGDKVAFGEEIDVEEVPIFPVVKDRRGRFVRGLAADAFRVLDHGVEAPIAFFAEEPTELSLLLLLDVSRSMTGKLGLVQEAACGFVDRLDPGDSVGAFAFNHALIEAAPPGTAVTSLKGAVRALSPGGGTALYDSVIRVIRDLDERRGRKVLVLFSDGRDERSLAGLDQVVHQARGSDVVLYAIGAGETAADVKAREGLARLAEGTGGEAFFVRSYTKLAAEFQAVLEDLRAQYYLTIRPREGPVGQRRLRVQMTNPDYRVRAREYYNYGSSAG